MEQIELGIKARDDAIARAGAHAEAQWRECCRAAIEFVAATHAEFTSDDVWDVLRKFFDPVPTTHEPRALGAIMRQAERDAICVPLSKWRLSKRPQCHRRPVRVWWSNLRQGNP
jgi:hypothetical protein